MSAFTDELLGKPSVDSGRCAICGAPGGNLHHVVRKGMGGVSAEKEALIPKMRLCGSGNLSGHHGMLHQGLLHIHWDDAKGGWVFYITPEPMGDYECWKKNMDCYLPVIGWADMGRYAEPIGGRR